MKISPALVSGVILVLLALVSATGAVSIGPVQTTPSGTTVTGLAYSPWYILLSIFLAFAGIAFAYTAGREGLSSSQQKQ